MSSFGLIFSFNFCKYHNETTNTNKDARFLSQGGIHQGQLVESKEGAVLRATEVADNGWDGRDTRRDMNADELRPRAQALCGHGGSSIGGWRGVGGGVNSLGEVFGEHLMRLTVEKRRCLTASMPIISPKRNSTSSAHQLDHTNHSALPKWKTASVQQEFVAHRRHRHPKRPHPVPSPQSMCLGKQTPTHGKVESSDLNRGARPGFRWSQDKLIGFFC